MRAVLFVVVVVIAALSLNAGFVATAAQLATSVPRCPIDMAMSLIPARSADSDAHMLFVRTPPTLASMATIRLAVARCQAGLLSSRPMAVVIKPDGWSVSALNVPRGTQLQCAVVVIFVMRGAPPTAVQKCATAPSYWLRMGSGQVVPVQASSRPGSFSGSESDAIQSQRESWLEDVPQIIPERENRQRVIHSDVSSNEAIEPEAATSTKSGENDADPRTTNTIESESDALHRTGSTGFFNDDEGVPAVPRPRCPMDMDVSLVSTAASAPTATDSYMLFVRVPPTLATLATILLAVAHCSLQSSAGLTRTAVIIKQDGWSASALSVPRGTRLQCAVEVTFVMRGAPPTAVQKCLTAPHGWLRSTVGTVAPVAQHSAFSGREWDSYASEHLESPLFSTTAESESFTPDQPPTESESTEHSPFSFPESPDTAPHVVTARSPENAVISTTSSTEDRAVEGPSAPDVMPHETHDSTVCPSVEFDVSVSRLPLREMQPYEFVIIRFLPKLAVYTRTLDMRYVDVHVSSSHLPPRMFADGRVSPALHNERMQATAGGTNFVSTPIRVTGKISTSGDDVSVWYSFSYASALDSATVVECTSPVFTYKIPVRPSQAESSPAAIYPRTASDVHSLPMTFSSFPFFPEMVSPFSSLHSPQSAAGGPDPRAIQAMQWWRYVWDDVNLARLLAAGDKPSSASDSEMEKLWGSSFPTEAAPSSSSSTPVSSPSVHGSIPPVTCPAVFFSSDAYAIGNNSGLWFVKFDAVASVHPELVLQRVQLVSVVYCHTDLQESSRRLYKHPLSPVSQQRFSAVIPLPLLPRASAADSHPPSDRVTYWFTYTTVLSGVRIACDTTPMVFYPNVSRPIEEVPRYVAGPLPTAVIIAMTKPLATVSVNGTCPLLHIVPTVQRADSTSKVRVTVTVANVVQAGDTLNNLEWVDIHYRVDGSTAIVNGRMHCYSKPRKECTVDLRIGKHVQQMSYFFSYSGRVNGYSMACDTPLFTAKL